MSLHIPHVIPHARATLTAHTDARRDALARPPSRATHEHEYSAPVRAIAMRAPSSSAATSAPQSSSATSTSRRIALEIATCVKRADATRARAARCVERMCAQATMRAGDGAGAAEEDDGRERGKVRRSGQRARDASVVDALTLRCGALICVRGVKH